MRGSTASALDLLSGDFRLDGSYYSSDGIKAAKYLRKWADAKKEKLDTLSSVANLFNGPRFPRIYVDEQDKGIPFLSSSDILFADLTNVRLLSKKYTPSELIKNLRFEKGWTLISCSGTIGNTVYVRQDMENMTGSQHIMRAAPKEGHIPTGYLYAFLSSEIAYSLLTQGTYGAVIQHIEPQHIESLPIPRLEQDLEQHIHQLIEQGAELRVQANSLLDSARSSLLAVNHLPPLTSDDYYFYGNGKSSHDSTGTFIVSSKDLSSITINAWNFSDKFRNLCKRIMAGNYRKFSNVLLPNGYRTGRSFKRVPMPSGYGIEFIGQKDLFGLRKIGKWISQVPIGSIETESVKDGTILIAGVGTNAETEVFGRCEFVWKNFESKIPAAEIIRIDVDQEIIDSGYLYAFLSSEYGFRLLRSTITGTKLCRFIEPLVMELPVPLPNTKSEMTNIGNMIRRAYDYRSKALDLEDQAQALLGHSLGLNHVN